MMCCYLSLYNMLLLLTHSRICYYLSHSILCCYLSLCAILLPITLLYYYLLLCAIFSSYKSYRY
jgi:hypothetical protein